MIRVLRALRLDQGTWLRLDSEASMLGASAMVIGTYVVLAFGRFGLPSAATRASTRLVLTGVYGWLWLALASWLLVRLVFSSPARPSSMLRLTGRAHLPLLVVASLMLVVSGSLGFSNVAHWPAVFAGVFWMPAVLASAVAAGSGLSLRKAAMGVLVPYLIWVTVVGRHMWTQLGHLL